MILLTGATGYVGGTIVERLVTEGRPVRALVRRRPAPLPGTVDPVVGDVTDPESLRRAVDGVDTVINLVAVLDGPDERFEAVNARGPANLVAAARAAGVRRFVHMSALGVSERNAPRTRYWGSKWRGASAVMASDLDWTVFEPSFVFGRGGGALAAFESLLRMPVVPVVGDGRYRHQPIWHGDIASAFTRALDRPGTIGKRIELGGPQALTFDEMLDEIARATGRRRRAKAHIPVGLMRAQSRLLRHLPPPLKVTDEQITMLLDGTECALEPMRRELDIEPASIADAYRR
jgi:NADH dehydrogenase